MRVLVAPDKFKEAASAAAVARAMAEGVRRAVPAAAVDLCPLADGGEGTVDVLLAALGGDRRVTRVSGPLGDPIDAPWALLADGRAVIETAAAAGLALVPPGRRDPTRTTTHGVGELIRAALEAGAARVIVGLGGSATVDGGLGALRALGLVGPDGGVRRTTLPIDAACDVRGPLLGPQGAAAVYGPQKGASPEQIGALEAALTRFAAAMGLDPDTPGAGAAGGLGYGLAAACGARLVPGAPLVLEAVRFAGRLRGADLVLTGEGAIDGQSALGKVVSEVARASRAAGVRCVALGGRIGPGAEALHDAGVTALFAVADGPMPLADALRDTERLVARAAEQATRLALSR